MMEKLYPLVRPLLHALDPEAAHGLTIKALKFSPPASPPASDPRLAVTAFGLTFPNPVGLAAGFDKHAEVTDAALGLGFGFTEVGTITPLPQPGNPPPRLFRLTSDHAVINRFGFNSQGHEAAHARLARRARLGGIVGVNIGANKDAADRASDYASGIRCFADVASYFTVNISSPNTPGLRDLQARGALDALLARVMEAREHMAQRCPRRPVLIKIAPDLTMHELDDIVAVSKARGIDGMIVSNTTLARPASLKETVIAKEAGGLSGRPLFALSTRMLAEAFRRVDGAFPLIGAGGIDSAEAAWQKIQAGAALVQLYSGLVFHGPGLPGRITSGLAERLAKAGIASIAEVAGQTAEAVCRETFPGA